jgi:hypothetical protein
MMFSKRSLEGYLMKDHRAGGGPMIESATLTCSHCQFQVILNPARSRERHYCPSCDRYICDGCEFERVHLGRKCYTFKQRMDDFEKSVLKGEIHG